MSSPGQTRFYHSYDPPMPNQLAGQPPQTSTRSKIRLASELKKYKKRSRTLAITTCIPAVTTLIFGGIVAAAEVITVKDNHCALSSVYNACKDADDKDSLSLGDHNNTLTVDEVNGLDAYECVASTLPIPKATQAKIGAANGFSGTQTDSWDGFEATWPCNKNNVLDLVIQKDWPDSQDGHRPRFGGILVCLGDSFALVTVDRP